MSRLALRILGRIQGSTRHSEPCPGVGAICRPSPVCLLRLFTGLVSVSSRVFYQLSFLSQDGLDIPLKWTPQSCSSASSWLCPETTPGTSTPSRFIPVTVSWPTYILFRGRSDLIDNWHFYGTQTLEGRSTNSECTTDSSTPTSNPPVVSLAPTADGFSRFDGNFIASSVPDGLLDHSSPTSALFRKVVARVSKHVLRLEREFQLCDQIVNQSLQNVESFVYPIELIKIPPRHGEAAIAISIFEAPGPNYLKELVSMGRRRVSGVWRG